MDEYIVIGKAKEVSTSWRDDPMTDKQRDFIHRMYEDAGINDSYVPPFTGKTKGEAYDYIHNYFRAVHYSLYTPHEDAGDRI